MKSKITNVILVFLLSISIAECSNSKSSSYLNNSSSARSNKTPGISVPTSNPTIIPDVDADEKSLSMEAYKEVLQNKAEFFSTDNKKNVYLNDFLTNKEIYGTAFKVTRFSVLDMDGDKVTDVILELSVGNEPEFYEVLHIIKGAVYGYLLPYRALEKLKVDGTFHFSSGAADSGWGKLSFEINALKTDILAQSKSDQGGTNLTISYFINNKPVTKEAFDSFTKEQSGKKDAAWYAYTQQNIEAKLPSNQ